MQKVNTQFPEDTWASPKGKFRGLAKPFRKPWGENRFPLISTNAIFKPSLAAHPAAASPAGPVRVP